MKVTLGLAAVLVLAGSSAIAADRVTPPAKPTQTGDQIGTVTMLADRSLVMRLRSVECDGKIAESQMTIRQEQRNYQSTIDLVGGLKPSETKPILAGPLEPCPAR